jgi:hypothetical protein
VSQKQGMVGRTPEGAGKMEEFWRGKGGRVDQENAAVQNFFGLLGVTEKGVDPSTSRRIRQAAIDVIGDQKKYRQKAAKKIYERAYKDSVTQKVAKNFMKDEVIADAVKKVNSSPAYRERQKGMKKLGIEYWDLVKRNIDGQIETALKGAKPDNTLATFLGDSRKKLVNELDKFSPMYKKARGVFSSESEVLAELADTNLGRLSKLKGPQLKSVSNLLFDPKEVDPKTLDTIRSNLFKKDPKVYYQAVAQNMLNKMDTNAKSATKRELPAFVNMLKQEKNYNMYKDALKYSPKAVKRLEAIKTAFDDILPDFTPKTVYGQEKTGMTNLRDVGKAIYMKIAKGGKLDQTAVAFITDPKWFDKGDAILRMKDGPAKNAALAGLLSKINRSLSKSGFENYQED